MKLLIFDTETTGLPKHRQPAEKGPNNWPHLVSISWILLESTSNTELKACSYIIKPQGWVIPEESTRIHGITNDIANECGVNLSEVMLRFLSEQCDAWVAHNLEFDIGVIMNAVLWDLRVQFPKTNPKKMCTMLLSKHICQIPGNYGYKAPKLKELYFYAFRRYPDDDSLHNSLYDVRILTDIIKSYLPLRQAMGLVASSVVNPDGVFNGKTLTLCFNEADKDKPSDADMGK